MGSQEDGGAQSVESRVVWLFGSPRSGSTWLRQMVAEHPSIAALEEPMIGYFLSPFLANEPGNSAEHMDLGNFTMRKLMEDRPHFFFSVEYEDVWVPGLRRLLNDRFLAHLQREVGEAAAGKTLLLVKEPAGSQSADIIMRAQPTARLLFLLRDGRDVVDSELAAFTPGGWLESMFAHVGGIEQAERLDFVRGSAYRWLWRTEVVEAALDAHRGPKHTVRYEDLLREPERHLRELVKWLAVPLDGFDVAAVANRFAFERIPDRGVTRFNRFATPGAWRENLRPDEQAAVDDILGAKLRELGYE
jgi:Sulfotransferase family